MSVAQLALARAKKLKEAKSNNAPKPTLVKKPAAKSTNGKTAKKASTRGASEQEKAKVAKMFNDGKPVSEISTAMGWVKKGDWPHYYTLGVIRQLRKAGVVGHHRAPESKSKKSKK